MTYMGTASTSPNAPSLVWGTIGNGTRKYVYDSSHKVSEVLAAGFIDDGNALGMETGDLVTAVDNVTLTQQDLIVNTVTSTGVSLKAALGEIKHYGSGSTSIDGSTMLKDALDAGVVNNIPVITAAGVHLINTDIEIDVSDGKNVDWRFDPGAILTSNSTTEGIIEFKSTAIFKKELSTKMSIGDREMVLTDASGIQEGDYINVDDQISMQVTASQNRSGYHGTVLAVDSNTVKADSQAYYPHKPMREIESTWDGASTSYVYRAWFAGNDNGVAIVDGTCSTAFVIVNSSREQTFDVNPVPSSTSTVIFRTIDDNDYVHVYRSGKVKISGFHWRANWSDVNDGDQAAEIQRRVLRFTGMVNPETHDARFECLETSATKPDAPFGRPEFVSGDACAKLHMHNTYVNGGGYSIRPEGYGTRMYNLTAEHVYKPFDFTGNAHDIACYNLDVKGASQPFGDHAAKDHYVENIKADQVLGLWTDRGTGLTIKNATISQTASGTDQGGGQKYYTADPLAIPEDDPAQIVTLSTANVATRGLDKIYDSINFLSTHVNLINSGGVRHNKMSNIRSRGPIEFSEDGSGPPPVIESRYDNIQAESSISFFNLRGAKKFTITNSRIGFAKEVRPREANGVSVFKNVDFNAGGTTGSCVQFDSLQSVNGQVIFDTCNFAGANVPWSFDNTLAQGSLGVKDINCTFDGLTAGSVEERFAMNVRSFAADTGDGREFTQSIGRSNRNGSSMKQMGNYLITNATAIPEEGYFHKNTVVHGTTDAPARAWICSTNGFALPDADERVASATYVAGNYFWQDTSSTGDLVYYVKTGGDASASTYEGALGINVASDYTDGTLTANFMGNRAKFITFISSAT